MLQKLLVDNLIEDDKRVKVIYLKNLQEKKQ